MHNGLQFAGTQNNGNSLASLMFLSLIMVLHTLHKYSSTINSIAPGRLYLKRFPVFENHAITCMPRDNYPQLAHRSILQLVAPCTVYYSNNTVYCTLYNSVHVLKLTLKLAYYSHSIVKMCLLSKHNSHQNREPSYYA